MKIKKTFIEMAKINFLQKLNSAKNIFNTFIQEKLRNEKENKKKQQINAEDRLISEENENKENKKEKAKKLKSETSLSQIKKKHHYSVSNHPKLEENTHNISSNEFQDLIVNMKKKKKRGIEELFTQNEPQSNQIIETEFIAKIEILTQENDFLKEEKMKLREQIILHKETINKKDQEILKLRSRLNVKKKLILRKMVILKDRLKYN